jgi:hypothetical protein
MAGGAQDADTASGVCEEGKNVESRSGQCPEFTEVGGEECWCLTTQEGRPPQVGAVGRGFDAVDREYLPDRGRGYGDCQSREFAVDAAVTPARVVASQSQDERADAADGGRSSRPWGWEPGLGGGAAGRGASAGWCRGRRSGKGCAAWAGVGGGAGRRGTPGGLKRGLSSWCCRTTSGCLCRCCSSAVTAGG